MNGIDFIYDPLDYIRIMAAGCDCTVVYPDGSRDVAESLVVIIKPKD